MQIKTRQTRAVRREQVVGTVLRIIADQGVSSLTTTLLAKEIGVTSGALFRHFATREEILGETVRHVAETIDGTFPDDSLPAAKRLGQLVKNRIGALTREPGLGWFLHSDQAPLTLPDDAVALLQSCARRSRTFVLDALREGAADGSIRNDVDPEHLSVMVLGTVHALIGRARTPATPRDVDGVVAALMRVLAPC
jgi:AcrR family transcriptional regulator